VIVRSGFVASAVAAALLLPGAFTLLLPARAAQDATSNGTARSTQSYTTITDIKVTPLSNGVQIRISADGVLQYRQNNWGRTKSIELSFPDARNGFGKNFLNVNRYPVSYVSLMTPQGAVNGIGLTLSVSNYLETNFQVAPTPDGQGVLITVQSDRTIESRTRGGSGGGDSASSGSVDTTTEVTLSDKKLTIHAVHADVQSLIAAIAEKSGLSVAVDDAVERKVSLNLQGVTPEFAVKNIAAANGLALSRIGGMYILSEGVPNDLATYRVSGTQSFRMQNTQAATASGLLPNFLYSYVKVNPEQNAVVVTAPSQMLTKIGQDLNKVDTPSPQIAIEAIVVELTDNADSNLGLLLNDTRNTSVTKVDTTAGTISYNSVGQLPQNFQLTLQALQQSGRARVRARPRMSVVNGRSASLFIGAQQFILTQFNSYGQTQTHIQPVDVGVKLAITPLTGGNGEITTTLAPEVSNITEQDVQTGLPVLSTRNASTTVRVRDGETIVIGGLTLNQEQLTNRKIPLLGDIPILGNLFRSQAKNHVQTELVVFVTPHVIPSSATPSPDATSDTSVVPRVDTER